MYIMEEQSKYWDTEKLLWKQKCFKHNLQVFWERMTECLCHHASVEHSVMAALTTLHISCTPNQLVSMSTDLTVYGTRWCPHDLALLDSIVTLVKLQCCLSSGVNKGDKAHFLSFSFILFLSFPFSGLNYFPFCAHHINFFWDFFLLFSFSLVSFLILSPFIFIFSVLNILSWEISVVLSWVEWQKNCSNLCPLFHISCP
jgi:hypothetical protein